jgi:hypothetical protein
VTKVGQCYEIVNFTQLNEEQITLNGVTFTVTENFISPDSAGISIDSAAFTIQPNIPVSFGVQGRNYSIDLKSISYIPIVQTVAVDVCPASFTENVTTSKPSNSTSGGLQVSVFPSYIIGQTGSKTTVVSHASGTGPYSYQWYNNTNGGAGAKIPGETSSNYTISIGAPGTYSYYVLVKAENGSALYGTSQNVTLIASSTATHTVTKTSSSQASSNAAQANQSYILIALGIVVALVVLFIIFRIAKGRGRKKSENIIDILNDVAPKK